MDAKGHVMVDKARDDQFSGCVDPLVACLCVGTPHKLNAIVGVNHLPLRKDHVAVVLIGNDGSTVDQCGHSAHCGTRG